MRLVSKLPCKIEGIGALAVLFNPDCPIPGELSVSIFHCGKPHFSCRNATL